MKYDYHAAIICVSEEDRFHVCRQIENHLNDNSGEYVDLKKVGDDYILIFKEESYEQ